MNDAERFCRDGVCHAVGDDGTEEFSDNVIECWKTGDNYYARYVGSDKKVDDPKKEYMKLVGRYFPVTYTSTGYGTMINSHEYLLRRIEEAQRMRKRGGE